MVKSVQTSLLLTAVLCISNSYATPMALEECGRVIAHEIGFMEFTQHEFCKNRGMINNSCPNQVEAVLKYNHDEAKDDPVHSIRWIKLSVRSLGDGSWVVAHDDDMTFYDDTLEKNQITVTLSKIDSTEFDTYRKKYSQFPAFRVEEYLNTDSKNELCWMLNTKSDPNSQLIDLIADSKKGIAKHTTVEVMENSQAIWMSQNSTGIHYSTRVSDDTSLKQVFSWVDEGKMKDMSMVEVTPGKDSVADRAAAAKRIAAINGRHLTSELDSMNYNAKEARHTGCSAPLDDMNSTLTMTSRPKECINGNEKYSYKPHPNILE